MKSTLVLASALALPLFYSTAMAGDESEFRALNGVTAAAMTNDQLAAVEGGSRPSVKQTAVAVGGDGGDGGAGGCNGTASCIGVSALNVNAAVLGTANQDNSVSQGNGGNGGNGGNATAKNRIY